MPSQQDMKHFGIGMLYCVIAVAVGFYICLDTTTRSPRAKWSLQTAVEECDHLIAEAIEGTHPFANHMVEKYVLISSLR